MADNNPAPIRVAGVPDELTAFLWKLVEEPQPHVKSICLYDHLDLLGYSANLKPSQVHEKARKAVAKYVQKTEYDDDLMLDAVTKRVRTMMLTPRGFKCLLMVVDTERGWQTRLYYIEIERAFRTAFNTGQLRAGPLTTEVTLLKRDLAQMQQQCTAIQEEKMEVETRLFNVATKAEQMQVEKEAAMVEKQVAVRMANTAQAEKLRAEEVLYADVANPERFHSLHHALPKDAWDPVTGAHTELHELMRTLFHTMGTVGMMQIKQHDGNLTTARVAEFIGTVMERPLQTSSAKMCKNEITIRNMMCSVACERLKSGKRSTQMSCGDAFCYSRNFNAYFTGLMGDEFKVHLVHEIDLRDILGAEVCAGLKLSKVKEDAKQRKIDLFYGKGPIEID